jgi:hypothetical protein
MRKMFLPSTSFVERAALLSRELTRMRSRGPGDTENAMRAVERDYGVDYWTLWRLRYALAKIRTVPACVYARLEAAYCAECERQRARLANELAVASKLAASRFPALHTLDSDAPETESFPQDVDDAGE